MALSSNLISQFVKATKDEKTDKNDVVVYGTVQQNIDRVIIDGSDIETPIGLASKSTIVGAGDRVSILIKNHSAIITGNLSNPAARDADTLNIQALNAVNADIETLRTNKLDSDTANITYATIENLNTTNANIGNLISDYGTFKNLSTSNFSAINGSINSLQTDKIDTNTANARFANIDFSNISMATIGNFFSESGIIRNIVVGDASITGELTGVTISGDLIEANTLVANKLVLLGSDGLYYKINTDGVQIEAQQSDQNSINGSVIKANSITATKINVTDLVAFGATIGGFNITNSSLYSGVKASVSNTTRGIFLGNDAQIAIGDSNNYIRYIKDSNNLYNIEIVAGSIKIGATDVASALERTIVKDTRSTNETPAWYITNYPRQTVVEFKQCATIGLTGATYCSLETVVPWNNNSGGYPKQTATVGAKQYWRTGANDTTWGSWIAASETATNFMSLDASNGLVVGDMTSGTLGGNVQIKAETGGASIALRNGTANLAKFIAVSKTYSGVTTATTSTNNVSESDEDDTGTITNTVTAASQTIANNQTRTVVRFDSANPIYFSSGLSTDGVIINSNGILSNADITLNGRMFDRSGRSVLEPITGEGNLSIGYGRFRNSTSASDDSTIVYGNKVKLATKKGATITHDGSVAVETLNSNGNMVVGFHLTKRASGNLNLYAKDEINLNSKTTTIRDSTGNTCFEARNSNGNTVIGWARYANSGMTNIYGGAEINLQCASGGNIIVHNSIFPDSNASLALGKYNEFGWSNIYIGNASGTYNGLRMIVDGISENLCGRDGEGRYVFGNKESVMHYVVKDVNNTTTGNAFRVTSGNNGASNNTSSIWLFGAADSTSRYIGSYLTYNRTYSSAANMHVTSNGVYGRSTSSSSRYKRDIVETQLNEVSGLYNLPIKKFKYKNDYIASDDELYDCCLHGIIVEDLVDILPCAVEHIDDGTGNMIPEMWNINIIVPAMLKLIQDLNTRLVSIESQAS